MAIHFKTAKERLDFLNGKHEEVVPVEVKPVEVKKEEEPKAKPKKKKAQSKKKKDDGEV